VLLFTDLVIDFATREQESSRSKLWMLVSGELADSLDGMPASFISAEEGGTVRRKVAPTPLCVEP